MNEADYSQKYKLYKDLIEKYLDENSVIFECPQKKVLESMRYSLMAGGKRIRPVFMFAFSELLGIPPHDMLPFAAAVEMIHTYSLIHDDLPVMDDDNLRRGKPSNHVVFGEATALLAGDAFLNKAFETMLDAVSKYEGEKLKNSVSAMKAIAEASGNMGMIAGQMVDIESEYKKITGDELRNMHINKTGALLKAACLAPVIMAGRYDLIRDVMIFSAYIGLMFQIKDDILDENGSEEILGKSAGSDRRRGKNTFVSVYGIKKCERFLNEYMEESVRIIKNVNEKIEVPIGDIRRKSDAAEFLRLLTMYLYNRNK